MKFRWYVRAEKVKNNFRQIHYAKLKQRYNGLEMESDFSSYMNNNINIRKTIYHEKKKTFQSFALLDRFKKHISTIDDTMVMDSIRLSV